MAGKANPRFEQALAFAAQAHERCDQERKGTDFPYVAHPIRVAEILDRFECSEDVIVAGFLHDTIEDTNVTADEIRTTFGPRVAELVTTVSGPDKSLPRKTRMQHTIERLEQEQDSDVLALVAADKLDDVRAITDTLRHLGHEKTWALFNANRSEQHSYYRRIAEVLLLKDPKSRLFRTLDFETQTLFPDKGHATTFFAGKPFRNPHDARACLADPIKHWRPDHSALELATIWIKARDFPPSVVRVLSSCDTWTGCRLVEGLFEREVDLGTKGRPSQTDLLALVQLSEGGYGVIAVEGKAREPFGPLVSEWNDSPGKQARLESLREQLALPDAVDGLYYQLLHRTVSAVREARRYGAYEALMLVHSFDSDDGSLEAYQAFAAALELTDAVPDAITSSKALGNVTLRLGWVKEC